MPFKVSLHPDVISRDMPDINRDMQERILNALDNRLATSPERYGHRLRHSLKGYWKLRVGDYRAVFRISGSEVWVLGIGNRKEIYGQIGTRLRWQPSVSRN